MAVFRTLELVAAVELAVQDQAAAHACTYKETDDMLIASRRAVLVLAQNADIYVIADVEWNAEFLLHGGLDVIVSPGKIGREQNDSLVLIDNAGCAGCDRGDLFFADAGAFQHLFHHADDHFLNVVGVIAVFLGLFLNAVNDVLVLVEDDTEDLGPPDVEADIIFLCHF